MENNPVMAAFGHVAENLLQSSESMFHNQIIQQAGLSMHNRNTLFLFLITR